MRALKKWLKNNKKNVADLASSSAGQEERQSTDPVKENEIKDVPHVLIVTHGRSGSTLLMGVLNAINGWEIKGENANYAYHLFDGLKAIEQAVSTEDKLPTDPWYGYSDLDVATLRKETFHQLRGVLQNNPKPQSLKCAGFKEVRYFDLFLDDPSGKKLEDYLGFLNEALAPCRVIFLTRDTESVLKSAWYKSEDREDFLPKLEAFQAFCKEYSDRHADRSFLISYQDIIERSDRFDAMFDFLGDRPEENALQSVLTHAHGSKPVSYRKGAIPPFAGALRRPIAWREADRLYALGKEDEAREQYAKAAAEFEAGKFNVLGYYAAKRAGRKVYAAREAPTAKLLYFDVPKCACTSISCLLYEAEHNKLFDRDEVGKGIHDLMGAARARLSLEPFEDFFKFTIVRDPVERFVSGYRNRIVFHGDIKNLLFRTGRETPDLNEFAMDLEFYVEQQLAVASHFERQCDRLGGDFSIFDKVYPIQQLETMRSDISRRVGRELTLPRMQEGGPKMSIADLNEEAFEKLLDYYAPDYEFLSEYYTVDRIRAKYAEARLARAKENAS